MFGKDKKKRSRRVNTKIWPEDFETCEKGNQSCMMAVLCAVILIVMILVSFLMKGNVNIIVGFLCFALLALAVYGFRLGLRGLNERDKKYITCKVGIGGKWIGSCRSCSNIYQGACVDDRDEI